MEFLKVNEYMLLEAAKAGDLAKVDKWIKDGADLDCTDSEGRTPLMKSIMNNNMLIAERLLGLGADPEIEDKKGKTGSDYLKENPENKRDPGLRVGYSLVRAMVAKKL